MIHELLELSQDATKENIQEKYEYLKNKGLVTEDIEVAFMKWFTSTILVESDIDPELLSEALNSSASDNPPLELAAKPSVTAQPDKRSFEESLIQDIFSKKAECANKEYFIKLLQRCPECHIELIFDKLCKEEREENPILYLPYFLEAIEELALRKELPQLTERVAIHSLANKLFPSTLAFVSCFAIVRACHPECYKDINEALARIREKIDISSQTDFFADPSKGRSAVPAVKRKRIPPPREKKKRIIYAEDGSDSSVENPLLRAQ